MGYTSTYAHHTTTLKLFLRCRCGHLADLAGLVLPAPVKTCTDGGFSSTGPPSTPLTRLFAVREAEVRGGSMSWDRDFWSVLAPRTSTRSIKSCVTSAETHRV